jgi:hypothetical protein
MHGMQVLRIIRRVLKEEVTSSLDVPVMCSQVVLCYVRSCPSQGTELGDDAALIGHECKHTAMLLLLVECAITANATESHAHVYRCGTQSRWSNSENKTL